MNSRQLAIEFTVASGHLNESHLISQPTHFSTLLRKETYFTSVNEHSLVFSQAVIADFFIYEKMNEYLELGAKVEINLAHSMSTKRTP